jgi:ADP-ribose pyrophosphatase
MSTSTRPRRLDRRVVYDGRVFRVEVDRVKLPNGRTVSFDLVRHRGSVVLLPQPRRDQLVLVRQYRYAIRKWIWELPAGSREKGESLSVCARRECEEEIGLRPRRVEHLATLYPTPGFCDELMAYYRCTDLHAPRGPVRRDVDEQLEPKVFSLREVRRLIRLGGIVDMKTVVGLGLVAGLR